MAKERNMQQPNSLGQYHRDIVSAIPQNRYYMEVTMTCGHTKFMSKQAYAKFHDHATLCMECDPIHTKAWAAEVSKQNDWRA